MRFINNTKKNVINIKSFMKRKSIFIYKEKTILKELILLKIL